MTLWIREGRPGAGTAPLLVGHLAHHLGCPDLQPFAGGPHPDGLRLLRRRRIQVEAQHVATRQIALGPGVGVQHPLAAPADPNEPKYCVCNRVSFGEMIACENEACAVEWFHFACVGLSTDAKIKGKWFCATCSADIKRQKKLEKKREEAKDADKPGRK